MKIRFTKMQGAGNDYIYLDGFADPLPDDFDYGAFAKYVSRRRFSVGADGVVAILPSKAASAKMRMFNADGSEGKMCGNASRCVAKYVCDKGYATGDEMTLETLSGIKKMRVTGRDENGNVIRVCVNMGAADFSPKAVPVLRNAPVLGEEKEVCGEKYAFHAVSMGNPHNVIFTDDAENLPLEKIGPFFENHPLFPERVNTEFAKKEGKNRFFMRVYERGSGETLACGTGACALAAVAVKTGRADVSAPIRIRLKGGELVVTVLPDYTALLEGTAVVAYEGTVDYEEGGEQR